MRLAFVSLMLSVAITTATLAQSDSLVIRMRDGGTTHISLSDIERITFPKPAAVDNDSGSGNGITHVHNYPNPFSHGTTLEFNLERPGGVTVTIHDSYGSTVRTLVSPYCTIGRNRVQWDGKDGTRAALPQGVYYYYVVQGNVTQSRAMVIMH